MKIIRLFLLLMAICAACSFASAQANQCYVVSYERDPVTKKQVSARIALGAFAWQDDKPLAGVIQDLSTGVFIAVRAERVSVPAGKLPKGKIKLAISFVDKPDAPFDEVGAAEAEATYDERWKQLSVSKNIKVADRLYTYYLDCDRGVKTYRPDVW